MSQVNDFYADDWEDLIYQQSHTVYYDGPLSGNPGSTLATGIMVAPRDPDLLVFEIAVTSPEGEEVVVRLDEPAVDELIMALFTYKVAVN